MLLLLKTKQTLWVTLSSLPGTNKRRSTLSDRAGVSILATFSVGVSQTVCQDGIARPAKQP